MHRGHQQQHWPACIVDISSSTGQQFLFSVSLDTPILGSPPEIVLNGEKVGKRGFGQGRVRIPEL